MADNALIPYEWRAFPQGVGNPDAWQSLLTQAGLWDGFTNYDPTQTDPAQRAQARLGATTDWGRLNGYSVGEYKQDNQRYKALRDPSGNIVGQDQYYAHDSLDSGDYTNMAAVLAMAAGGYGLENGFGAGAVDAYGAGSGWGADTLSAMGQGVGAGETAGLSATQVGALNGGGGTGVGSLGSSELASVPQMANFTSSLPEMATMSNASIAGNGGGLLGLSGNTWANLAQTGVGLLAQNRATNAMTDANNAQLGLQRDMWQQNRADNQPLLDLRNQTLPQINALMRDPSSITQDPGYQFGLKQGQGQIDNSSAAKGGYYSGAQLKATQRYGQDYAGTKLDQSLNRLMGVAGLGQIGGTNNQSNNNQFSQQQGNALMNGGNIRGSGYMGMANTIGTGIGGIYNDNQQNYWNQRNPFGGP